MATYVVFDGHSLAYRAWFALQEAGMKTASGQETQAVYGFVSMLTKLLDDLRPDGVAVAFDRAEPTFRDAIVEDYKAGRPSTPEPLREQLGLIRQFVEALGVPVYDAVGFEADDVIGTLATRIAAMDEDVLIVTGDRDTYQLVSDPHVKVMYNRRGVTDYVLYDEAGILERTGVRPVDYPLLAALRGDSSDNLPGVPGVGDKTAAKLVNDHHDVDGIFANLAKLTPKLRESLAAHEEQVRRNLQLTPIVCDVPLEIDLAAFVPATDRSELERLLTFLEMRTLKERLFAVLDAREGAEAGTPEELAEALPVLELDDAAGAATFLGRVDAASASEGRATLEPDWAGVPGRSAIDGIAVTADGLGEIGYLSGVLLGEGAVAGALARLVAPGSGGRERLVVHRAKELLRALLADGIDVTGLAEDTAVISYLVDPSSGQESLEEIARRHHIAARSALPAPSGQLGFDLGQAGEHPRSAVAAERVEVIRLLAGQLDTELADAGEQALWEEIERPLVRVLAKMEHVGVGVDAAVLEGINAELTDEAKRLEEEVHAIAGESFNLSSPPQLRVILYDKLGLRPQRRTKTGFSTDAQTLERLRDQHPIVDVLLRYREVEKLRSTYGVGLLAEIAPDGRIHASFNQTVARTGRLSSDAPNLHNIPVRTEGGRRFREAFIPAAGSVFLVADYNQIELRVIAHLAKDPGLVAAFAEGRDIHRTTAAGVFGVDPGDVTPAMRAKAKMVSYGLAYGMEAYGLSQRLGIAVDEAAEILAQYFIAFPAVRAFMEETVHEARRRGYTETERGRRRYLPELTSDNYRVRQAAERQAMNAGIQGLAADIFKIALVRLDETLGRAGLTSPIVLQVHDEIVLEVREDERDEVRRLTLAAMEQAYPLRVPLEVNVAWGETWADAKPA